MHDFTLVVGGRDGEIPFIHPKITLKNAWVKRRAASRKLNFARRNGRPAKQVTHLEEELDKAHAEFLDAACNLASIPSWQRWEVWAEITDYSEGAIDITYGDLDPDSDDHGQCTVYVNGRVTHWRTPWPDDDFSPRIYLEVVE